MKITRIEISTGELVRFARPAPGTFVPRGRPPAFSADHEWVLDDSARLAQIDCTLPTAPVPGREFVIADKRLPFPPPRCGAAAGAGPDDDEADDV